LPLDEEEERERIEREVLFIVAHDLMLMDRDEG